MSLRRLFYVTDVLKSVYTDIQSPKKKLLARILSCFSSHTAFNRIASRITVNFPSLILLTFIFYRNNHTIATIKKINKFWIYPSIMVSRMYARMIDLVGRKTSFEERNFLYVMNVFKYVSEKNHRQSVVLLINIGNYTFSSSVLSILSAK